MKIDNKVLVGLGVIAVVAYIYRDKIFSKKETTTKNEPSSGGMSLMPSLKPINTSNLGLNTPTPATIPITPSIPEVSKDQYGNLRYTPSQQGIMTQEEYKKLADIIYLRGKNCPQGKFC
jgi:hypothetical protein